MTDGVAASGFAHARVSGRPRILGSGGHSKIELTDGWRLCGVKPGAAAEPSALDSLAPAWEAALVPGTVAAAARGAGNWDIDRAPDYDALDWWYECRFQTPGRVESGERWVLCFDGLATLADVWVNDRHVLTSDNMFVGHEVDVTEAVSGRDDNSLKIRFRSLRTALEARRPRPRWRTKLVENQQLRWQRTTLLGRMPGWSPPVRAVGPWRAVRLERRTLVDVVRGDLRARPTTVGGIVDVSIAIRALSSVDGAHVEVNGARAALELSTGADGLGELRGTLTLPDVERWWPHTHGKQPRYDARVVVSTRDGDATIDFGKLAFRDIALDRTNGGFVLRVNGVEVFCRGACWTTPDIVTLRASASEYAQSLALARAAGMNMIRVGGTMVYEDDAFYDACDELGILVWQDFMFANMDYPIHDAMFAATLSLEAEMVLARIGRHPCLALFCGNSEVEQQAAMLGMERERWSNAWFDHTLPALCGQSCPDVPYWTSSPSGGPLPFHVDQGVAHYYGVGAYLRPLEDARRSNVRFTSECLGFSNVPDQRVVDSLLSTGEAVTTHPRWKARVPRDHGTGWDFEDVRDHYLALLFGVDPIRTRYADPDRYLALSRVVTGEVMARTIGEWRRAGSTCRGALVWFYQDLWAGAGWGVLDASGRPKAAYYAIRRAMQPIGIFISDEGQNGLALHLVNDEASAVVGEIRLTVLRAGKSTAEASREVTLEPRSARVIAADEVLGRFADLGYAYRFGPPGHDTVVVTVTDARGVILGEAFHFPVGIPTARVDDPVVSGVAERVDEETVVMTLRAEQFAQYVAIDAGDFIPEDNYFHMTPGTERRIVARAPLGGQFDGFVQALNARDGARVPLVESPNQVRALL